MITAPRRALAYLCAAGFLIALLLAWQWYATSYPNFSLPTPVRVGTRLFTEWLSGGPATLFLSESGLAAIGQTFSSAVAGWALGALIGIVAGSIIGASRILGDLSTLPLLLVRSVPPVAVIPICIVLFGLGFEMKLVVVSFTSVWPTLLNTASAVSAIEPLQLDVARLNRLSPLARFFRVLVPASSPKIFAGLRVSLSLAIMVAVGSELFAGTGGLGGLALVYRSAFDVPGLWATLVVLAMFGLVMNGAFLRLENLALRWDRNRSLR